MPNVSVCLKALKPKPFPELPKTLAEHLKKRRLELGLTQRQVSKRLRASASTLLNWETGKTEPLIKFMPGIIQFLGYDPFPKSRTISERMLAKRRAMGWSIKEAAQHLGVDDRTWAEWEETGVIVWKRYCELLEVFIDI